LSESALHRIDCPKVQIWSSFFTFLLCVRYVVQRAAREKGQDDELVWERRSTHEGNNRAERSNRKNFLKKQSLSSNAKLCCGSQHAGKLARVVWEGGNGKGLVEYLAGTLLHSVGGSRKRNGPMKLLGLYKQVKSSLTLPRRLPTKLPGC
jgi:hypothetical protein